MHVQNGLLAVERGDDVRIRSHCATGLPELREAIEVVRLDLRGAVEAVDVRLGLAARPDVVVACVSHPGRRAGERGCRFPRSALTDDEDATGSIPYRGGVYLLDPARR